MKPSTSNIAIFPARRALIASAMAVLLGTATAVAQGSGAGGTRGSSGSDTSRRSQPSTSSGSTGSYDTGSTTGSSTTDTTSRTRSGTTDTSRDRYGTGGTSSAATGRDTRTDKLSWGDRRFVSKAADEGHAERQLAQLAAERASNMEVRTYAQKLAEQHSKVNSELMSLANQKGVKIDMDDDKDRAYKRLEKKSGSEFDQEFVEHMIDEHEKDIKMFEKAASDAKDPEVRSFASKHVNALREHLQEAQDLHQTLMPTGRTDESSGRSTSGGTTGPGLGTSSTDRTSTGTTGTQRGGSTGSQRDDSSTDPSSDTSGTSGSSSSDTSTTPRRRD
jgi:putative membrane protein